MTAEHAGTDRLTFSTNGAAFFRGGLDPGELQSLERALTTLPSDQAGIRLRGIPALDPFLASTGPLGLVAASVLGPGCHPVRAILFDKTATKNWSLGWHQDRTIAVKERIDVTGFGPWTVKDGLPHVEPPFELLAEMVTLRAHIDAVPTENA